MKNNNNLNDANEAFLLVNTFKYNLINIIVCSRQFLIQLHIKSNSLLHISTILIISGKEKYIKIPEYDYEKNIR